MSTESKWKLLGVYAMPSEATERRRREWPAVKATAMPLGGGRMATSYQFGWVDIPADRNPKAVDHELFVPISHIPGEFFEDFVALGLMVADSVKEAQARIAAARVVERRKAPHADTRERPNHGRLRSSIGDMLTTKKENGR